MTAAVVVGAAADERAGSDCAKTAVNWRSVRSSPMS